MALTFVSVILRYLFAVQIPDNYDFARLVTGVFIFWGIAVSGHRGEHIQMDAVWYLLGPRGRLAIDAFATFAALVFFALLSERLVDRVGADIANQTTTLNLAVVIWPFHLVASLGMFAAALLVALRLWRLVRGGVEG